MQVQIIHIFEESAQVKVAFARENAKRIVDVVKLIAQAFRDGKKVILFGNGGSSTDASHIAAEFVNRFLMERPPLPAIALNTDVAVLTSISNHYSYDQVFSKQLTALGHEGDVVIVISTSGNSPNVLKAVTLVYSSGTTGEPKGIVISHRSRALTFHGMAMEYGCYGPDDFQLGIAPMSHGAGFAFIMASLYFGGAVEVLPRFDPELVLSKLGSQPFTGVFMVPTHFQAIFGLGAGALERWRGLAGSLRTIMSNAAALPQAVKEKIVAYFGEGLLHETYGSTEAGIVTNLRPRDQLVRKQSVGHPFAVTQVRLLDDEGREVSIGEVGELYSLSPYIFNGYFNRPEETAKSLRDGWVTAGDLARRDADGFLYIVGRKKDMVVTGGLNGELAFLNARLDLQRAEVEVRSSPLLVLLVPGTARHR